jgi:single-strand DNA-binding protein
VVTQFTLAVDRPFSSGEGREREADFIPVVTWRQLAETSANYLKKGRLTAIEGRIQVRHYDNNEGKRVYVTEVIADTVRFLESGNREGGSVGGNGGGGGNSSGNNGSNRGGKGGNGGGDPFEGDGKPINIHDDDLPF